MFELKTKQMLLRGSVDTGFRNSSLLFHQALFYVQNLRVMGTENCFGLFVIEPQTFAALLTKSVNNKQRTF